MTDKKHGGSRQGSGKPSPWGEGRTKLVRVPERFCDREILWKYLIDLPEALENAVAELEPRKHSERVKLAYERLSDLLAILVDEDKL